ncbi:MAG: ferrous iron transport protein B [Clostridiales bacterium]|jgi:ferrous iron transport protein B|nr:ferrous iron transport protein B [Clostridiales bacterium]
MSGTTAPAGNFCARGAHKAARTDGGANKTLVLTGNPNAGKTSVFNRVTRSNEKVSNWHGVTVEMKSKRAAIAGGVFDVVDLPGLYSLTVYSPDEEVSRDRLLSRRDGLVINVCEVNNLSRNLYLTLQLMELGADVFVAVNMIDELTKRGKKFNAERLSRALGVPVFAMSAKNKPESDAMIKAAAEYLSKRPARQKSGGAARARAYRLPYLDALPLKRVAALTAAAAAKAGLNPEFAAIKVLEGDGFIIGSLNLSAAVLNEIDALGDTRHAVAAARFSYIDAITDGVITDAEKFEKSAGKCSPYQPRYLSAPERIESGQNAVLASGKEWGSDGQQLTCRRRARTSRTQPRRRVKRSPYQPRYLSALDRIVLNKYLALPIFLLVMAAVFALTFGLVGSLSSRLLRILMQNALYDPILNGLTAAGVPLWIRALLCDGVILGVGGILTFLPQIALLFLCLSFLEDSGYVSRVAYMTDGLFRRVGLSGRSCFTILMGLGCAATAVMTARGLEDETMRKKTVLLTPFMSCSARLPVYSVICAAFFASGSVLIIFGLYLLGAAAAIAFAALFEKCFKRLKSGKQSFIMELPPYRLPGAGRVGALVWQNVKTFLIRVATVIFALNVIVWVLSNFSFTRGYVCGTDYKSIFETLGAFLAPLFSPLGFGSWRAVTALMGGLIAKEVVITSIESLGGAAAVFTGVHAKEAALSFMIFTLLYTPCVATLAAVKREAGTKWMLLSLSLQSCTAYAAAAVFYGACRAFSASPGLFIGAIIFGAVALFTATVAVRALKRGASCPYLCADCPHKKGSAGE